MAPLKDIVKSYGDDLAEVKKNQQRTDYLMIGIIVVFFIGFIGGSVALGGIIIDAFRSREGTYQELSSRINEQVAQQELTRDQVEINNANIEKIKKYFGIR